VSRSILPDIAWFIRKAGRNRARLLGTRMRSPRYAIAIIIGALYFGALLILPILFGDDSPRQNTTLGLLQAAGPLLLVLLVASWWLLRSDTSGIVLTPAESSLLVPAPISRTQLILFKLLVTQPAIMVSALIAAMLAHSATLPLPLQFLGSWLLFTTLQLHRYGASFVSTSLAEHGRSGLRRMWPAALAFAVLGFCIFAPIVTDVAAHGAAMTLDRLQHDLQTQPAATALAPFRAVIAPFAAETNAQWLQAMVVALGILILHFVWVIRMNAAFEEGAANAGYRRAQVVEAVKAGRGIAFAARSKSVDGRRGNWFPLSSHGHPAVAILWHHVLSITRGLSRRIISIATSVLIFVGIMTFTGRDSKMGLLPVMGIMLLSYGGMVTFMAPARVRYDFRSDLRRLELLRTLPVGGTGLAAAEIATSSIVVTLMQFALVGAGLALSIVGGRITADMQLYMIIALGAVLLPVLNATMIVVHNGFTIVFPAWSNRQNGGIEMFGFMLLFMLASLVIFAVLLIAPLLIGGVMWIAMSGSWGTRAGIPAAAAALAAACAQLWLLIVWLGRAYDRMDPTGRGGMLD
jgi:hypothetical protein